MARGVYTIKFEALAVTAAITLVQVKAGANAGFEVVRAWVSQSSSVVSTQQRIQLLVKTAAATVTSFTPLLNNRNDAAALAAGGTSATGTNASAEGTDGDVLYPDVFNILNGWLYLPTPEERPQLAPGQIIGLKFPAAPGASTTYSGGIVIREFP